MKVQDDTVRLKSVLIGTEKHCCHAMGQGRNNSQWICPYQAKVFYIVKSESITENLCVCIKSPYQICSILVSRYLYPSAISHALLPEWKTLSTILGAHGLCL